MGKSVTGSLPASPGIRSCCMLTKEQAQRPGPLTNILEPNPATYRHVYGSSGLWPKDEVG